MWGVRDNAFSVKLNLVQSMQCVIAMYVQCKKQLMELDNVSVCSRDVCNSAVLLSPKLSSKHH